MDRFYKPLREELGLFEEQVHQCRVDFDLQTLQRVLALLSEAHKTPLDSWRQIETLVQNGNILGGQGAQFRDYLSWLLSYVEYLRTMKTAFDDRIVFPLCDNLYVNDEGEVLSPNGLQLPLAPDNIAATARQLFHHRRSWALLLSSRNQGQAQQIQGASHSTLLLHRIPDIFEESLVTANLARHWVLLHETRHKNIVASPQDHLSREFHKDSPKERELWRESRVVADGSPEAQSQVKDTREYLMFLLWRAGRAEALELQVKETNHKVWSLLQDINETQKLEQENGAGSLEKMETLKRQLDLERFHQAILSSDWQLELEVRPSLIREIDAVRECCSQLEANLSPKKQDGEESPQDSVGVSSDTEWDSSSVFSHSSTRLSDAFTPR
ncbi:uncharacterized protein LOC128501893 [Spea bombifrons]|uniref:uncharacterized protein LOC128501893 n=1 Tax=Spea bombifrons TaxID=233779 RepID=UPI00234998ED|nr:uncharacterized protein LOC128501893 [Spea bombifrons]